MKSSKRALPVIILVFALILSFAACQRLADTGSDAPDADQNESQETESSIEPDPDNDGYLIPQAVNNGYSLLYGYVDKNGKTVIEPKFKKAEPFYACGIAEVKNENDRTGLIDKKGNYLVEPEYDYFIYNEGLFLTYNSDANLTYAFDEKGKKKFECAGYPSEFNDGLSPYYSDTGKGYINTSGELVIKLDHDSLSPFFNGIAKVSAEFLGESYYIDTKGNDLTDKRSSGLRLYKDPTTELFGYKNANDEIVIQPQFGEADPFLDGFAIVNGTDAMYGPYYGIIDTQGSYVLEPRYCGIQRMKNGIIAVGEKTEVDYVPYGYFTYSKKALFTPDMAEHTDWIYYSVDDFDKESVCVNDEDSVFFIGRDLKKNVNLPVFKGNGFFKKDGDLLRGQYNSLSTVADLKGNILVRNNGKTDLGNGITAEMHVDSKVRTTTLSYPVIMGIKDKSVEEKVNALIVQDMMTPYGAPFPSSADVDPFSIMTTYTSYVATRQNDLLLIDQFIEDYMIGANHPSHYRNTLYIDLKTGVKYALADLFRSDEVYSFLSDAVSAQMKEKMEEIGYWEDHVTVTPDVGFAIADGGIILYFGEYELASYAAGMQEFFIPFKDLDSHIDKQGAFWKSFNP